MTKREKHQQIKAALLLLLQEGVLVLEHPNYDEESNLTIQILTPDNSTAKRTLLQIVGDNPCGTKGEVMEIPLTKTDHELFCKYETQPVSIFRRGTKYFCPHCVHEMTLGEANGVPALLCDKGHQVYEEEITHIEEI
jgi:hypothetical protein